MTLRKLALWLHLMGGLVAAAFLFALGASGAIIVFETEIDHWLNARLFRVEPQGARLSLDEITARVEKRHPGFAVGSFNLPAEESIAVVVGLRSTGSGKGGAYSVNPYTGEELGSMETVNRFTRKAHQFHTNLLLGPPGKTITHLGAWALLGLSLTGLFLWWPTGRWRVRRGVPARQAVLDFHSVLGVFSSLFMMIFAVTGIVIHWDDELIRGLNGLAHQQAIVVPTGKTFSPSAPRQTPDQLLSAAQARMPGARVVMMQDLGGNAPVHVFMKYPEDGTPAGRTYLYLDPTNGAVLAAQTSRTAPLGSHVVGLWNREVHTGDICGLPTRILACLASLCLPLLAATGPLLWLLRFRRSAKAVA